MLFVKGLIENDVTSVKMIAVKVWKKTFVVLVVVESAQETGQSF